MRYAIRPCTIWKIAASGSAISGLVCFALSSTYKISFGKLGCCGLLLYQWVGLFMFYLILRTKTIPVSQKYQGLVVGLMFGVFCSIAVLHDKYAPKKSDKLSISSFALFSLMSLSIAKKLEIGFETGCSAFFLQLFVSQLSKSKECLKLLPFALVFCVVVIVLRHYPEHARHQIVNDYPHPRVEDPSAIRIDVDDDSSQVINHSPSNGQGGISELDNQQNEEEEDRSSSIAESSGNSMLGIPTEPGLPLGAQPQALKREKKKEKITMTRMTEELCRTTKGVFRKVARELPRTKAPFFEKKNT